MQQLERHPRAPQFPVHPRQVRLGPVVDRLARRRPVQPPLQRVVREPLDIGRGQPREPRPADDRRDRPQADPDTTGHLAVRSLGDPLESQNLS